MNSNHYLKHQSSIMLTCHFFLILFIKSAISALSDNLVINGKKVKCLKCKFIYKQLSLFFIVEKLVSLNRDIGLLRDENKNQNMEIALLKKMFESQDKKIREKIITEIEQRMKYDESSMAGEDQYSSDRVRKKATFSINSG